MSDMRIGVIPWMDNKKTYIQKRLDFMLKNMLAIMSALVNEIGGTHMTTN